MPRKPKAPPRLEKWHQVQRAINKRGNMYDVTLDLTYGGQDFDELRQKMAEIEAEFGDQFERFKVEVDSEYQYDGDIIVARVYGYRVENDVEYQARMDANAAQVAAREQRDRDEFDRLAKKFGKTA